MTLPLIHVQIIVVAKELKFSLMDYLFQIILIIKLTLLEMISMLMNFLKTIAQLLLIVILLTFRISKMIFIFGVRMKIEYYITIQLLRENLKSKILALIRYIMNQKMVNLQAELDQQLRQKLLVDRVLDILLRIGEPNFTCKVWKRKSDKSAQTYISKNYSIYLI